VRKTAIVTALSFMVALMLIHPVSAGSRSLVVQDREGDLGCGNVNWDTCEFTVAWPDNTPVASVGYFDILSFSLTQKAKMYTFGMEVAAPLPDEGSALPNGFKRVQWLLWIDAEPWNLKYNPTAETLFTILLSYDGSGYTATLRAGLSMGPVVATLPYEIDGAKLQIEFSAASIGSLQSFWIMPCTVVEWSVPHAGFWDLDSTDPGAVPGQVWWDIPWPPA